MCACACACPPHHESCFSSPSRLEEGHVSLIRIHFPRGASPCQLCVNSVAAPEPPPGAGASPVELWDGADPHLRHHHYRRGAGSTPRPEGRDRAVVTPLDTALATRCEQGRDDAPGLLAPSANAPRPPSRSLVLCEDKARGAHHPCIRQTDPKRVGITFEGPRGERKGDRQVDCEGTPWRMQWKKNCRSAVQRCAT